VIKDEFQLAFTPVMSLLIECLSLQNKWA